MDGQEGTQQRTYLCPACDGLGEWEHRPSGDPQQATEHSCHECSGTGVVTAARDAYGLQPWTGDRGRAACRMRRPHLDPLQQIARLRADAVRQMKAWPAFFRADLTPYGFALGQHMRPVLGQLRMVEAAIRCDVTCRDALAAWRSAA